MSKDKLSFEADLRALINTHSQENASGTPDYILAEYLVACLDAFGAAVRYREEWYGRPPQPVAAPESKP